jgi:hypothetical protein
MVLYCYFAVYRVLAQWFVAVCLRSLFYSSLSHVFLHQQINNAGQDHKLELFTYELRDQEKPSMI